MPLPCGERDELSLLVFSQSPESRIEVAAWNAHVQRFFGIRLTVAEGVAAGENEAHGQSAHAGFVIEVAGEPATLVAAFARPRNESDLAEAESADAHAGARGFALVARRCPSVWVVHRTSETDAAAMRLAMGLSSLFSGPILDRRAGELFGPKTARAKIEQLAKRHD
jgi:hypothetical protein